MRWKCPKCGATLIHKSRILRDKRCKKSHVIQTLACSTCDYVKPSLEVRC